MRQRGKDVLVQTLSEEHRSFCLARGTNSRPPTGKGNEHRVIAFRILAEGLFTAFCFDEDVAIIGVEK